MRQAALAGPATGGAVSRYGLPSREPLELDGTQGDVQVVTRRSVPPLSYLPLMCDVTES
jgi:hypothetical protein